MYKLYKLISDIVFFNLKKVPLLEKDLPLRFIGVIPLLLSLGRCVP